MCRARCDKRRLSNRCRSRSRKATTKTSQQEIEWELLLEGRWYFRFIREKPYSRGISSLDTQRYWKLTKTIQFIFIAGKKGYKLFNLFFLQVEKVSISLYYCFCAIDHALTRWCTFNKQQNWQLLTKLSAKGLLYWLKNVSIEQLTLPETTHST